MISLIVFFVIVFFLTNPLLKFLFNNKLSKYIAFRASIGTFFGLIVVVLLGYFLNFDFNVLGKGVISGKKFSEITSDKIIVMSISLTFVCVASLLIDIMLINGTNFIKYIIKKILDRKHH